MIKSLRSTIWRYLFDSYDHLPWITYPAIDYLAPRLRGRRLFEFGSGTSTSWYAQHCREVVSVENDPQWFERVTYETKTFAHVDVRFAESDADFIDSIQRTGGRFGAIVIDCKPHCPTQDGKSGSGHFRIACLRRSLEFASDDCIFVIDNTDALHALRSEVESVFSEQCIHRFPGWVPGILHPNETTVVDLGTNRQNVT